jgi:hypothetical protein
VLQISSTEKEYSHRLVRLIQGYRGPHAPPVVEEEINEVPVEHREDGQYQHARPGSYALVSSWANVSNKPGDDIEVQFYVQPYLLDVDHHYQALISCLDISSRSGFAVVLRNSRLEFLLGTGENVEVLQSQFPVNRWGWLRVQLKIFCQTFTSVSGN